MFRWSRQNSTNVTMKDLLRVIIYFLFARKLSVHGKNISVCTIEWGPDKISVIVTENILVCNFYHNILSVPIVDLTLT